MDGPLTRPDPVGFVRRAMAYAPRATLVVYGLPEPSVASALIAAGARGVIRGGDTDLVTAVTKTVLLLGLTDAVEVGAAGAPRAGACRTATGAADAGAPPRDRRSRAAMNARPAAPVCRINGAAERCARHPQRRARLRGARRRSPVPRGRPVLAYANGALPRRWCRSSGWICRAGRSAYARR